MERDPGGNVKLKVNETKSAVARPQERKSLGFGFTAGPYWCSFSKPRKERHGRHTNARVSLVWVRGQPVSGCAGVGTVDDAFQSLDYLDQCGHVGDFVQECFKGSV